jgi:exodeoxyribonuclease VII large subunit
VPERLPPKQVNLFGEPPEREEPPLPEEPYVIRKPPPTEEPALPATGGARRAEHPTKRIYTVRELTREIKGLLGGRFLNVHVRGEVSNLKPSSAGHYYFTLKDQDACLNAVVFRKEALRLKFKLQNGQSLVARGHLDVYEAKGEYQLICDTVEPVGAGALQIAFEQLKARLQQEGLFAQERKRKLPFLPKRIALVTSPQGAAVHDFLRVLHRRFPGLAVLVVPVKVQGEGAAQEIARGVIRAGQQREVEVVVVARGGGSLEDLWAFNEEVVARAIAKCPVPTVSAVGHEVDFTIADFVADARAATPTAAAEMLARVKEELRADLWQLKTRLQRAMRLQLERRQTQIDKLRARVADPRVLLAGRRRALDELHERLDKAMRGKLLLPKQRLQKLRERLEKQHPREKLHRLHREVSRLEEKLRALMTRDLARQRERLMKRTAQLDALSPLKVLARGYSVAFDERGHALTSAEQIQPGERLRVRLHRGELRAQVLECKIKPE